MKIDSSVGDEYVVPNLNEETSKLSSQANEPELQKKLAFHNAVSKIMYKNIPLIINQ